jgi:hypothetical protein
MVDRARSHCRPTWLVEQYLPGMAESELDHQAALVRTMADEMVRRGAPLRYLGTTIVPTDEALLTLIEADSIDVVRSLCERACIPPPRITAAIHDLRRRPPGRTAAARMEISR